MSTCTLASVSLVPKNCGSNTERTQVDARHAVGLHDIWEMLSLGNPQTLVCAKQACSFSNVLEDIKVLQEHWLQTQLWGTTSVKRSQGLAFLAYPVNTGRDTQDPWQIASPSIPVVFPRLTCVCNHYRKVWYYEITDICALNTSQG